MPTRWPVVVVLLLAAGAARGEPEPGFSLEDEWNALWRRVADRGGRPDPDGPVQQRFAGALYPEYELDLAVPAFPLRLERAWAERPAGARLWVQSLDEFELATRAQLKVRAPLGRAWRIGVAFDRLQTRTVQSDLVRVDVAWDPACGTFVWISATPRWEKDDSDVSVAVGRRHPAFGEARLRLFALDPFTNASTALAESRDEPLERSARQVDLPVALAAELVSRSWRGARGELYAGGIVPQATEVRFADPAGDYQQEQSGWLAGALVEWKLPDDPLWLGATGLAMSTRFRRAHDAMVEEDREVSERTRQLRGYALWAPVAEVRVEGQLRWTSRPESADGVHRRDREWLTSLRGAWMFAPPAGIDLGLLRYDRSASGPPEVRVEGDRHRLVTRMLLQLGSLWASFGASWDLDPVGKGIFGGGGATLIVDL
ncbi:MAG TPA: hypothetical protein VFU21_08350 [Kofleriaceae bacterium]|nr:hypothetical protein [Kofleriaceae bacterium]